MPITQALGPQDSFVAAAGAAAQRAAAARGLHLYDSAAVEIARAVLAVHDGTMRVTSTAPREAWEESRFRERIRNGLRHDLFYKMAEGGYVPAGLPSEVITYQRWRGIAPQEVHPHAVEQGAPWDQITITLTIPTRAPLHSDASGEPSSALRRTENGDLP